MMLHVLMLLDNLLFLKHQWGITTPHCVISQKNPDLIYIVAETWNHALQIVNCSEVFEFTAVLLWKLENCMSSTWEVTLYTVDFVVHAFSIHSVIRLKDQSFQRSSFFWVVTQPILVVSYWHFLTACRCHHQGSDIQGGTDRLYQNVGNYRSELHNVPVVLFTQQQNLKSQSFQL